MVTQAMTLNQVDEKWERLEKDIDEAREVVLHTAENGAELQAFLQASPVLSAWNQWAPWIRDTKLSHDLHHAIYEQEPDAAWEDRWWIDGMLAGVQLFIDAWCNGAQWAWRNPAVEKES